MICPFLLEITMNWNTLLELVEDKRCVADAGWMLQLRAVVI